MKSQKHGTSNHFNDFSKKNFSRLYTPSYYENIAFHFLNLKNSMNLLTVVGYYINRQIF